MLKIIFEIKGLGIIKHSTSLDYQLHQESLETAIATLPQIRPTEKDLKWKLVHKEAGHFYYNILPLLVPCHYPQHLEPTPHNYPFSKMSMWALAFG
jgi:hypothetical protein